MYIEAYKSLFFDKKLTYLKNSVESFVKDLIKESGIMPPQIIFCYEGKNHNLFEGDILNIPTTFITKKNNCDIEALLFACANAQYDNSSILCINYHTAYKTLLNQEKQYILQMQEKYTINEKELDELHKKDIENDYEEIQDMKIISGSIISLKKLKKNSAKIMASAKYNGPSNAASLSPIFACAKLLNKLKLNINEVDLFEVSENCSFTPWAFARAFENAIDKVNKASNNVGLSRFPSLIIKNLLNGLYFNHQQNKKKIGIAASHTSNGQAFAIAIEL